MNVYAIEGVGDDGYVEAGATEISGIRIIDDKTLTITTKWETALYTFENNYGRYILILPEHILGDVPKDQLLTNEWFNAPTVVSGPCFIQDFDLNHYVANENYWLGAPNIKYLNINVFASSQLLAGLQSGEIDLIQQTMGDIPLEDYESVRALENVTIYPGTPITNQSIFINVENVPDVRIRQALTDPGEITARYLLVDQQVQQDAPMISAYILSALGATSNRLVGATPDVFGTFINVHEWDIAAETETRKGAVVQWKRF
ncbi:MAG: ABC transporter substrate-binding protein [Candidatus Faecivicinus sp.]